MTALIFQQKASNNFFEIIILIELTCIFQDADPCFVLAYLVKFALDWGCDKNPINQGRI